MIIRLVKPQRTVVRLLSALCIFLAANVAAGAPIPDDVLIVGQTGEPKSLDPNAVTALNDFRILVNMYDGLVRYKANSLDIEPALATSWAVSDGGLTYTFHLRKDVRFHDGSLFDAEAVKFNFERMLDPNHPYHDTGPFPLAFFFDAIKNVEVVDDHTVRLRLDKPFAPLISNLAYPTGLMVSPAAVRKWGRAFGRHPSGTGPFRFVEWQTIRKITIERNPDYWDGAPMLRQVIFRPLTDVNARITEMMAGNTDLMVETPPDMIAIFRKGPAFDVSQQAGPHLWYLILNMRKRPFTDRRIRLAVNYGIDKKSLVRDVLQGTATVAAGPVPKAFDWAYNENLSPYPYDPEKARALVSEADKTGARVTFLVPQGGSGMLEPVAMATAIQADLAEIGLRVEIKTFEWNTYLAKVNDGLDDADMGEMAWMTNDPDTLPFLALRTGALPEKGGFNSGYYSNPEVDRLIEKARRTSDRDVRARLYKKMQKIVYEDVPWAFIASWKQTAVTTQEVNGFRLHPSFLLYLKDVYKE